MSEREALLKQLVVAEKLKAEAIRERDEARALADEAIQRLLDEAERVANETGRELHIRSFRMHGVGPREWVVDFVPAGARKSKTESLSESLTAALEHAIQSVQSSGVETVSG